MSSKMRNVSLYSIAYLIASWMDLATTSLGLSQPGVTEKNIFAFTEAAYSSEKAWLLTGVSLLILAVCFWSAMKYAKHVNAYWLQHPWRSFGKLYFNPWSSSAVQFTPIHFLSVSMAFVILRVLAAANNLGVYFWGFGPIGKMMILVGAKTSPLWGFVIVGMLLFMIITVLIAPVAAKLIAHWQRENTVKKDY